MLKNDSFELKKWASNNMAVMKQLSIEKHALTIVKFGNNGCKE